MPLKQDNRLQLNIKHAGITPEFLALVRKAAERQGQTLAEFVIDTLRDRAQAVIKGATGEGSEVTPTRLPVRLEDIAAGVTAIAERFDATARELAERLAKLESGAPTGRDRMAELRSRLRSRRR